MRNAFLVMRLLNEGAEPHQAIITVGACGERPAERIHLISSPIKSALLFFDPDQTLLLMAQCCGGHR